jgi:ribonucleotide monophosphatase NagD (HAD superfamily)
LCTERLLGQIPVYSSNPDLVFASSFPTPRLAAGAFVEAWKHVWKKCYHGQDFKVRV